MHAQEIESNTETTELIDRLRLVPHPEGGFYREIFRSAALVHPEDQRGSRSALTTIYYLLPRGAYSRWHRVKSDEVWHFYEGDPLRLFLVSPDLQSYQTVQLGGARADVVHTVPAQWWQAAEPLGRYALCGCTVGPGFEFSDFSFAREVSDVARGLPALAGDFARLL